MFTFLIPLFIGFLFNSASAFTTFYSRRLGERNSKLLCIVLRDVIGIPAWAVGYVLAARASSPLLFNSALFSSTLGWLLILAGGVIIIVAMLSLGWRAATPSTQDTLVRHGLYAHLRHPLYSGMVLELVGIFLLIPSLTVLVACMMGVIWAMFQARLEEIDLLQRLPAYKEYMQQVPRFVPKFKLH